MANLTRAMTLTRWADGLATRTTCTLWVPIPGTQVVRRRRAYDLNAVNFRVVPSTGQGASLLRDLAATKEPMDADSRRTVRALLAECAKPTLAPGAALAAILAVVADMAPEGRPVVHRQASDDAAPARGPWQSAMPADVGDSFAMCEGLSDKVHGIERRRRVWCKRTERGHNAIVRRRARVEGLIDGKGTPCWDGLPALMRKVPA